MDLCNTSRNVAQGADTSAGAQQTLTNTISKYTPARHRALLAMRCARSKRPFNSVLDPDYQAEVELLRPGTVIPSPRTISEDVKAIYKSVSQKVKEYFSVCCYCSCLIGSKHAGSIHLVIDGWTAPFAYSYLGVVIVWFAQGKIWRTILEFIR
ncbi:hypothetical protein BV25DRAFT_1804976 [Artomyces pyxidatus]|uniref:Uncharacterized protein n=1 Tax=Artomyces pyxidatus TaxID=48021 RepID=A0ACB8T0E0_9AGAM|nr:hypothetical protein BV25DRAFT_1804976 [Artomyces pyxidatus]